MSLKTFDKILFITDFSKNADHAFQYALSIADQNNSSEMTLVFIIPEAGAQFWKSYLYEIDEIDQKAENDINLEFQKKYLPLIPDYIKVSTRIIDSYEHNKILQAAKDINADLIVLGRESKGSFVKLLSSDTLKKITQKSICPVLVVPSEQNKDLH